jgi:hypothetical protein
MQVSVLGMVLLHSGTLATQSSELSVPKKLRETFSAILELEEIYHNEFSVYAPNLETLKAHFKIKDSLEMPLPGFEVYAVTRDNLPFLFAIDGNGDSLIQASRQSIRFSRLDQAEYPIDEARGIDPAAGLQVRLELPLSIGLKGSLAKGSLLCSFTLKKMGSRQAKLQGCSQYLTVRRTDSMLVLVASLPAAIPSGEPWSFAVFPHRETRVKGGYHSRADRPYPIRGSLSPEHPFRIFSRVETRRKE